MTRGPNMAPSYIIRVRSRVFRDHTILGGGKVGPHRRRVASWSAWKSHRFVDSAAQAIEHLALVKDQHRTSDVGVFYEGRRLELEQLRTRAKEGR
jgi:hypothetical protein